MNKCKICRKEVELTCCSSCADRLFLDRMTESMQGDTANRIKWIIDDQFFEFENRIIKLLEDRQIIKKDKKK